MGVFTGRPSTADLINNTEDNVYNLNVLDIETENVEISPGGTIQTLEAEIIDNFNMAVSRTIPRLNDSPEKFGDLNRNMQLEIQHNQKLKKSEANKADETQLRELLQEEY